MKTKSIILFGLATAIVTSALVFDGVSHRRTANRNQAIVQNPATSASTSPNYSIPPVEVQPAEDQSAASLSTTDSGDPAPDAVALEQSDADVSSATLEQPDAKPSEPAPPQPIVIPAGTMLTVRLGEALGSRISEVGQKFSATLDRDVVVGGETVIAAGARVTGKVVSAKPAGPLAGEAHLQLKLTSVNADNARLTLATSVRSFGPKIKGKNKVGRFMKGLVKRASGEEKEVLLAEQSACSFTLQHRLQIQ